MLAVSRKQGVGAEQRRSVSNRFKPEAMLRGLKSFRENLSKGMSVLQKNDPLEFSPIFKALYDSGILQVEKLLEFNLSHLVDKSLEN